jgi:nucleotide-binding universal stress UspA family protein
LFRKILLPADLSERNAPAVELAAKLASSKGAIVHLLHVIELIPGFTLEEESEFYGRLEKAAHEHLAGLKKVVEKAGVACEAEVVYGPRARTILEVARRIEVDLIVIQSHRVEPEVSKTEFSTLSYQIGVFASCPVLLVK